jgi:ketosteroid isomerase-like protein
MAPSHRDPVRRDTRRAMSQENVEIVRRLFEAFNDRGADDAAGVVVEFFDPEIEWHDAPSLPGAAVYRGHEALRRHIEDYLDAWADSRVEMEEIRAVGDRVLSRGRYVGVGRQSGISIEDNVVTGVYDLRGGRVLRVRQFVDQAKALAAVGLSE